MAPGATGSGRPPRQPGRRRAAKAPLLGGDIGRAAYKRRFRQECRTEMATALAPLSSGLAVIYTILLVLVLAFADRGDWVFLLPLTAGSAFAFFLLRLGVLESPRASRATIAILLLAILLVLTGAALQLTITGNATHTTALGIVALAAGFLVLNLFALILVEVLVALSFAAAVWLNPSAEGWVQAGAALAFTIGVSFVVFNVRMRGVRRMAELRIGDERHKTVLSRSFNEAQESERRFRMLSTAAFEGIIALRGETIRDINPAGAEIFGRPASELVGASTAALGRTEDGRTLLDALTASGDQVEEFPFRTFTGALVDLEARSRKTRFHGEDALVVTVRDVTERRRHEMERARLNRQLTLILESTGEGILGLDADARVTFANPAAGDILGRPAEALDGMDHATLLHPDHACPPECPIRDTVVKGQTHAVIAERFATPFGKPIPVDYVSAPMLDQQAVVGAVVAFRDISERLEVERLKDQFVSVVSHELKTPLTSMQGALRLVDAGKLGEIPPQAARMIHIATENTARLIRLVQDILDVERFRAGRVMLEPEPVDAKAVAERAYDTMKPLADARSVVLKKRVDHITFQADSDRVLQALTNLLSNAIKFSPDKGTVQLVGQRDGDHIRFEVRDEGPGIPADQAERIFERFHQLDSSHARKFGGTGLGLAICRAIAVAHGGTIHVERNARRGSTFILRLPIDGPDAVDPGTEPTAQSPHRACHDAQAKTPVHGRST